jgi:hypothetical protein
MSSLIKSALMFTIGFLACALLIYSLFSIDLENPLSINGFSINSNSQATAPSDWIRENQIQIFSDKIVIKIQNASLSKYASTGSMKPVFDESSNGIRIAPKNSEQLNIGDIVTYEKDENLIVHRIVSRGQDEQGEYFIVKGDNNQIEDGKIRFSQIKYVTIAVLY